MDIGKIAGGILFVGATAAIWFWPKGEKSESTPDPIRPVRSCVIASDGKMPDLSFAGTVRAGETRMMTFKQTGRIQRLGLTKGERVKKGDELARLDPKDFQDRLAQATAALERDRKTRERTSASKGVSQEQISQAEARFQESKAAYELAQRALEETVLVAPFDCMIADVPAEELDVVTPGSPVVVIQDLSTVKIDVVYPESLVIRAKKLTSTKGADDACVMISFDSLPGRSYPAKFIEYTAMADVKSQTYCATYEMVPPEDLLLLPGMSATMSVSGDSYAYSDGGPSSFLLVPAAAIGSSSDGAHFVWKLTATEDPETYEAHMVKVAVAEYVTTYACVTEGVAVGERLATAGVSMLTEGQRVHLMKN